MLVARVVSAGEAHSALAEAVIFISPSRIMRKLKSIVRDSPGARVPRSLDVSLTVAAEREIVPGGRLASATVSLLSKLPPDFSSGVAADMSWARPAVSRRTVT